MALPSNRFALTPQRPGRARNTLRPRSVYSRVTMGHPTAAVREQAGHALLRPARAPLTPPSRTQATAWRTAWGKLGTRLRQALWRKQDAAPDTGVLAQALGASLAQRRTMEAALNQAKAELAKLRTELAGTQAGERMARHQAMHDGLTGLPNRRLFMEQLHQALRQCAPAHSGLCVMYLDVDGFKRINDEHGHQVGDGVLRTVGARLAKSVRAGDTVARLGGDEFACLLTGSLPRPRLRALAEKLCASIAAPMKLDNLTLVAHVSIGLACYPDDGTTADTLMNRADAAMYQAKQRRTRVMFATPPAT